MSKSALRFLFASEILLSLFLFTGCGTPMPSGIQQARIDAAQKIAAEPLGDYFIGRRYFKGSVYKFWGYVRKPGQPWSTAQLVVFNEKEKLAPDREKLSFGSDNLTRADKVKLSARVTFVNLTNKEALYNFNSTFSGTHFVTPRSIQAQVTVPF